MSIPAEIFLNPDWFPEKMDLPDRRVHFCSMARECYERSPFLDNRIVRADSREAVYSMDELVRLMPGRPAAPSHYVFHNAFCCSTLFSRCLNASPDTQVLREPNVLLELASILRYAGTRVLPNVDMVMYEALFRLITGLLSRRYRKHDVVYIKPSDGCNNLISRLLAEHGSNTGLFIYSELERFLTAIMKVPGRQDWVKIRATELYIDEFKRHGRFDVDLQSLTNARLAVLVWVLHMRNFRNLLANSDARRIKTLDSEMFMANQAEAVARYFSFTACAVSDDALCEQIDKLNTHSKADQLQYTAERREHDFIEQRKRHAGEVESAMEWAEGIFGSEALAGLGSTLLDP